jgi:hypothetical protein
MIFFYGKQAELVQLAVHQLDLEQLAPLLVIMVLME